MNNTRALLTILIVIVLAVLAYGFLTMRDQRTTGEKIGDAIDALPHGVDKAAQQLQDRTPGQKLGDAVKDTGNNVGDKIDQATKHE